MSQDTIGWAMTLAELRALTQTVEDMTVLGWTEAGAPVTIERLRDGSLVVRASPGEPELAIMLEGDAS